MMDVTVKIPFCAPPHPRRVYDPLEGQDALTRRPACEEGGSPRMSVAVAAAESAVLGYIGRSDTRCHPPHSRLGRRSGRRVDTLKYRAVWWCSTRN